MSGKAARRRAREFALQGIYQWLLSGNSVPVIEDHVAQVTGFDKADRELFVSLLRGTLANVEALQEEFIPFIHRSVDELSPVERAILLLATQELKNSLDTPYRVIINEAIELAKSYGGTEGHRFVNGVLDKLAAKLRAVEVSAAKDAKS
ncbi:transcription antitermination factor NusB [Aromatoleum evansii]|uniref:Transcription antitermination protein NusB n=1 Tax=Aromatoleum evansii TaxID=59406 RepID=A0ABZ1AQL5_AROEV|nr:transcription antitermination factor NusB [Aromatoleum evansii]NMG31914.1 transcription antitermination factor NusB [Aromatoleum evansii]WRL46826.1 transcription antitermination factor NusB [Aromatoleum evansii]